MLGPTNGVRSLEVPRSKHTNRFQNNSLLYLRSDSGFKNCQQFIRKYGALSARRLRDSLALFAIKDATAGWAGYPGILISRASFMAPAPSRRKVALFDWITELRARESCLGPFHRSSSFGASSAPVHCRIFCQRLPYCGCWIYPVRNWLEIGSSKGWRLGL